MGTTSDKLVVAAVEAGGTAAAAAYAAAAAAAGVTMTATGAASLAAVPVLVKAVVEQVLDARRSREAREQREQTFVQEMHQHLEQVVRRLESVKSEAKRAAWRALDYEEVVTLVQQFLDQAMKAPGVERRSMLSAAAAGSFRPDLKLETKSRVARVIEQLEPSDVLALRRLAGQEKRAQTWDEVAFAVEDEAFINRSTLLRVGCLVEKPVLNHGYQAMGYQSGGRQAPQSMPRLRVLTGVTPLAHEVLEMLHSYGGAPSPAARRPSLRKGR